MAQHQITERQADREVAARSVGLNDIGPRVFAGQIVNEDALRAILEALGGGFEDSALMEIVNPATGRFWFQEGISQPVGGTDDIR